MVSVGSARRLSGIQYHWLWYLFRLLIGGVIEVHSITVVLVLPHGSVPEGGNGGFLFSILATGVGCPSGISSLPHAAQHLPKITGVEYWVINMQITCRPDPPPPCRLAL